MSKRYRVQKVRRYVACAICAGGYARIYSVRATSAAEAIGWLKRLGVAVVALVEEVSVGSVVLSDAEAADRDALERGDWTLLRESGDASTARMAVDYYARPDGPGRDFDAGCEVHVKVQLAARSAFAQMRWDRQNKLRAAAVREFVSRMEWREAVAAGRS